MVYKGTSHWNGWWLGVPSSMETFIWWYLNHLMIFVHCTNLFVQFCSLCSKSLHLRNSAQYQTLRKCIRKVMRNWRKTARIAWKKGYKYLTTPLLAASRWKLEHFGLFSGFMRKAGKTKFAVPFHAYTFRFFPPCQCNTLCPSSLDTWLINSCPKRHKDTEHTVA